MNSRDKTAFLRNYSLKLEAGIKQEFGLRGSVLRVISALVPIYFETRDGSSAFYLEAGEEIVFDANVFFELELYHLSGIEQNVIIAVGENAKIGSAKVSGLVQVSNAIDLSASSLAALESIDLNSATRDLLRFESYGASYRTNTAMAANTPETIFTAAANVNGAIIHAACLYSFSTGGHTAPSLIAKATAPASTIDGDGILSPHVSALGASLFAQAATLGRPVKIPAGKGLYFIAQAAETTAQRSVLYTLL